MAYSYIILGAGRQGTAAAYDLGKFGEAARITLVDADSSRAASAARRVNSLLGSTIAQGSGLDVTNQEAVNKAIQGYHVALSAVPYVFNLALTKAAIAQGVSFCDMGGNTEIVRQQHALDEDARRAGVRVIPDCGMGPGMGNTLAVYAMSLLDQAEHVYLYDGGLPLNPQSPWNYQLTFNIKGLTNEYYGGMTVLREGKRVHLPCFSELEIIDFPPLGQLEAIIVAGGVSTAPWTFEGQLQTYQLKILRYPGSFCQLKAFSDLGLFDPDPIQIDGIKVTPRRVFETLYGPQVEADEIQDICVIRARVLGQKDGKPAEVIVELVDQHDPATGFTAMERTTGWHASIVAALMASGKTPLGAIPLEIAVSGDVFVQEARRRGFHISERVVLNQ